MKVMNLKYLVMNTKISPLFYSKQFYIHESLKKQWSRYWKRRAKIALVEVRQLQDVLQEFAKKLVLLLNISDLKLILLVTKWVFSGI
jgi:hypothetical protein